MKAKHAKVLKDFEASSVILFAALIAGDFRLPNQAPSVPANRSDAVLSRPASRPSRAVPNKAARALPAAGGQRAPEQRTSAGGAVARAIEQMESGQIQGFVPFE